MKPVADRLLRLLPALWAGLLLCVAGLATPAPFAVLDTASAGRVVGHIFAREAALSLVLGAVLLIAARRRTVAGQGAVLGADLLLPLGVIACTVLGYYATQPMMAEARAGRGAWSFGQLHAFSFGLFALKMVLVGVLAWRAARPWAQSAD